MELEEFKNEREFYKKFPGRLYVCSMCKSVVTSKIYCSHCGFRADGLIKTNGEGYKYKILENGEEINEIFRPIEL